MKRNKLIATLGLAATLGVTAIVPTMASASVQNDKNNARNLAIAGAAIAGYGLLSHNTGATVLGAIGGLVGLSQEQKYQNIENSWHDRWGDHNYYYRDDQRDWGSRNYNGYDNRDYNGGDHRNYQNDRNYQGDNYGGDHNYNRNDNHDRR